MFALFGAVVPGSAAGSATVTGAAAPVLLAVPFVVVRAPELVAGAVVAGSEAPVPAAGVVVLAVDVEATPVAAGVTVPVSGAAVLEPASVFVAAGVLVSSALTLKGVAAITPVTASAAT